MWGELDPNALIRRLDLIMHSLSNYINEFPKLFIKHKVAIEAIMETYIKKWGRHVVGPHVVRLRSS